MIRIYNTLSKKKEDFIPLEEGKVRMYVCGPTVYNFIHIGNARPMIVFDTVRRYMQAKGYEVHQVSSAKALSAENWGLGFGEEGKAPTANQTAEELKQYDAYYIGNENEKKIYLTFQQSHWRGENAGA